MASPSTPPSLLASVLPITGMPMIIQHETGHCLISAYWDAFGMMQIETRLSGDFQTADAVRAYIARLTSRLVDQRAIWPLIEASCQGAPPIALITTSPASDPDEAV